MTKTFTYNINDDVYIQPYTLFENPTPIAWNNNPYGYGKYYIPNEHFKFDHNIDIYAQYNPMYIHYFETDLTSDVQHIIYENKAGTRIEIAQSLTYNPNFICWNTPDNDILLSGQYITLKHDISACISCEYKYELQFNSNGGQGYIESIYGLTHVWVDVQNFSKCISHYIVSLPYNTFTSPIDKKFIGWTINDTIYQPGETIELTSDMIAYATWVNPITYTLNGYVRCVNMATTFRYMMVNIVQSINNDYGFAIQRLQLINEQNEAYIIPLNTTVSGSVINDQQKTNVLNLIKKQNVDFIISSNIFPYSIIYDFQIQCLNIKKYNKWQWYTASNLSNNVKQNIKWIQLLFSNDGIHWFMGSDIYDKNEKLPQTDNTLSYTSTITSVEYYPYDFMYKKPNSI